MPQGGLDWVVLVEGLVLLIAILVGVYVIFLYWRRQTALAQEQRNFISQVSHEFKSPLASLQLHLETVRLRRPDPQQLDSFLETMLDDTVRLRNLVDNLLDASRLEQRRIRLDLKPGNLSQLVEEFFREQASNLPEEAQLTLDLTPNLHVLIDHSTMYMVLRNLLENALLYSLGPPVIRIKLTPEGSRCHLSFSDRGRGIAAKDRKKVFRMFYRVRKSDETIRGSGLGLFIVKAVIWRHKGKVWLESDGIGHGTTFHILLPRIEPGDGTEHE
ncbi:MAG: HAMP domain-containing sensor histidine kinase [Syntrophotaleaceae bacterium]